MRCSTNFEEPTEDFNEHDRDIVETVQRNVDVVFARKPPLNHVLAQIYPNCTCAKSADTAATKTAVIKAHSDKTKDMDTRNGVLAFVTFYDGSSYHCIFFTLLFFFSFISFRLIKVLLDKVADYKSSNPSAPI
jgi:hypothetical protein